MSITVEEMQQYKITFPTYDCGEQTLITDATALRGLAKLIDYALNIKFVEEHVTVGIVEQQHTDNFYIVGTEKRDDTVVITIRDKKETVAFSLTDDQSENLYDAIRHALV